MNARTITSFAMAVAGAMLAHQTASKAVREAVFLSGPGVSRLPAMVMVTSLAVVAAVPAYARLLARFGPRTVVPIGFLASAAAHLVEWQLPAQAQWVAIVVYLHVAGFGALLLSGFWSLVSELFDPRTARTSFSRIAAAGTAGGLAGGAAVLAAPVSESLLVLSVLHVVCAAGIWWLARQAPVSSLADASGASLRLFDLGVLKRAPYLGTLALLVVLSTASAGIVDYLFKKGVADWSASLPDSREALQRFFAVFYMGVGLATFIAQATAGRLIGSYGIGRAISALPVSVATSSIIALVVRTFPFFAMTRGIEAVLRGSWFRSAYELLFVPMAPDEKRNTKTFLDVTCDRAGDAIGAGVVQLLLFVSVALPAVAAFESAEMLLVVIGMAGVGIWLGRRVDNLYIGVVADRLAGQNPVDQVAVQSETGWTILDLPAVLKTAPPATAAPAKEAEPVDPRMQRLTDLRSGDRARVEAALRTLKRPDRVETSQVVQLLAWDELVPMVRLTLERAAATHLGLLADALGDRETDFAIRRRIPKILGTVTSDRSIDALLTGLEDVRFEVRYQCARAINRIRVRKPDLVVDADRVANILERELSVPLQVWQGHRLLDKNEGTEESGANVWSDWEDASSVDTHRNLEHVFSLLAMILPREPLQAAFRGMQSNDPELRALTLEYFEGVLPPPILVRLWALPDFAR